MPSHIILSDFIIGLTDPSFSQNEINENFIKYMSIAFCVDQNIQDQNKANEILLQVKSKVDKYSISENFVSRRSICALERADFFKDYSDNKESLPPVYQNLFSSPKGENITKRMELFQSYTLEFLDKVYANENAPSEIIYVTSTGHYSPTPIQVLLNKKKWIEVEIKNSLNMDCYASVPAVKLAMASLAKSPEKKIDLIHSEIQSLHMNLLNDDPSSILINSLFGDGAVKYTASRTSTHGLKVLGATEALLPDTLDQMGWNIGTHHFEMILSPLVPHSIAEHIESFLVSFLEKEEESLQNWKEKAIWAVHPGGPKIVDLVSEKLNLKKEQLKHSWEVLNEHGNISSSTLPFIWKRILEDETVSSGQKIISLAFGPGLTACALLMEKL